MPRAVQLYQFPTSGRTGKQPEKVFRGCGGDFFGCRTLSSPASAGGLGHQGRLVALAAIGRGSEPGRVGFDQDAVEGHAGGHVAERLRLGIGKIAGKGEEEAQVERAPRLLPSAAEAVHDAAQAGWPPMLFENVEKIVPGVGGLVCPPAMDQDGPLARGGDFELADEPLALHVARGAFVVVVEADFAAGDDFGLGQKGVQLGQSVSSAWVCCGDRCRRWRRAWGGWLLAPVEFAADVERLVHLGRPFADADGEHRAHAGLQGAAEHGLAVVGVARAVEVGVGIDQQTCLAGRRGNLAGHQVQFRATG